MPWKSCMKYDSSTKIWKMVTDQTNYYHFHNIDFISFDKQERINIWSHDQFIHYSLHVDIIGSYFHFKFPSQRPVTRSFDVFIDLRMNKWLSEQSWGWWFEMPSRSLWRHCNDNASLTYLCIYYGATHVKLFTHTEYSLTRRVILAKQFFLT